MRIGNFKPWQYSVIVFMVIFFPLSSHGALLNCIDAVDMGCAGGVYTGTTVGGRTDVDTNPCVSWDLTGPEKVFFVTPDCPGDITAVLSGMTVDLDAAMKTTVSHSEMSPLLFPVHLQVNTLL